MPDPDLVEELRQKLENLTAQVNAMGILIFRDLTQKDFHHVSYRWRLSLTLYLRINYLHSVSYFILFILGFLDFLNFATLKKEIRSVVHKYIYKYNLVISIFVCLIGCPIKGHYPWPWTDLPQILIGELES